ncbi:MAG: cytochrome P450 [Planctomycetota bacterium]
MSNTNADANAKDPFKQARADTGIQCMHAEGQDMPLILRLRDVRKTCKDWKTFSNDDPFMIVPHSEADVRSVRQLPIETDPPDHKEYRALVDPFFKRPGVDEEYQADMRALVDGLVMSALGNEIEAVREFALPLQSRSLARLLGVDESEADLWISWGTHVFKEGDGVAKGADLAEYIRKKFVDTECSDGDDFFSTLNRIEFRGRRLTLEEKHGFANMAFAGGRDTVIHSVSGILAYVAEHPEALDFLREDDTRIVPAVEEFVRHISPLTAIARKCPHGAEVSGVTVEPGERVGLCWPSANRDAQTFEHPDDVVLDRAPNPHVGFGFGIHNCLGAPQARLILRSLLTVLCDRVGHIDLLEAVPDIEEESSFKRQVGYSRLRVKMSAANQ